MVHPVDALLAGPAMMSPVRFPLITMLAVPDLLKGQIVRNRELGSVAGLHKSSPDVRNHRVCKEKVKKA